MLSVCVCVCVCVYLIELLREINKSAVIMENDKISLSVIDKQTKLKNNIDVNSTAYKTT